MSIHRTVSVFLLFSASSLLPMDRALQVEQSLVKQTDCFLRVHNLTHDVLLIRYQPESNVFCSYQRIIPGQWIDFAHLTKIKLLQVKGYSEWISSERFFVSLSNLAERAKKEARRFQAPGITITVRSGWDYESARTNIAYIAACFLDKTVSYAFTFYFCEGCDQYTKLSDAFPQVEKVLQEKSDIKPDHVLQISPEATLYDGGIAYENIKELWQKKKASSDMRMQEFAEEVLALCDLAYKAFKEQQDGKGQKQADENFRNGVWKRFIAEVKSYKIKYDHDELLKSFLTVSGILASSTCEQAGPKIEELKKSSARFAQLISLPEVYEMMLRFLAEHYYGSASIQNLTIVVCTLQTTQAQQWLMSKVQNGCEWRAHSFFVFKIFENFGKEFYKPIARALGKYSLAVNMCNDRGNTSLMEAVLRSDFDTVNFLIDQNADRAVANKEGKNALTLAQDMCAPLLQSWNHKDRAKRLEWEAIIVRLNQQLIGLALVASYVGQDRMP